MPAFYNLVCDGLLSENFAIIGLAMDAMTTESFREKMSTDIKQFSTRANFEQKPWDSLCSASTTRLASSTTMPHSPV